MRDLTTEEVKILARAKAAIPLRKWTPAAIAGAGLLFLFGVAIESLAIKVLGLACMVASPVATEWRTRRSGRRIEKEILEG